MVAIVDGQQSDEVQESLAKLVQMGQTGVNIDTEVIDLATLSDEQLWQLEDFDGSADTPLLQVFYPAKDGKQIKCWEGSLNPDSIADWLDSPMRKQIAADLVSGESAVFLLIDGVDEQQSHEIATRLQASLSTASTEIKIPDGVVKRSDANKYLQQHPESSMDDVLRSDVPLRVNFGLRRLSRNDPNESALRSMVYGLVEDRDEPILVPIFGRGRMLDAMKAQDCDDQVVMNACRYMVGECSCTVKALNPGVDLILSVDWSDQLGQAVVMIDANSGSHERSDGEPTLVAIPSGETPLAPPATVSKAFAWWGTLISVGAGLILLSLVWRFRSVVDLGKDPTHKDL